MRKFLLFLLLVCTLVLGTLLGTQPVEAPGTKPVAVPPLPPEQKSIMITAVGDIMMHNTQISAGWQPASGSYDFSAFFRYVKPILEKSSFAIGNLETTLGTDPKEYGGYPRFNCPAALAYNLKEAGLDLITTANNHALDKGISGLQNTLQHLDEAGLLHAGTARSQEEKEALVITEIEGINTAVLAYTYGTNGLEPPAEYPFAVNYINEAQIINDIKKAQESGAQLVILCLHFGEEYQETPNKLQTALVKKCLQAGADLILGTHPHVLQPARIYLLPEEDSTPGTMEGAHFVSYSLGNFISDQNGLPRKAGIILNLHLTVDSITGKPSFEKAEYIPIWTRRYIKNGRVNFEVIPIEPALKKIRAGETTEFTVAEAQELQQAWVHVLSCLDTQNTRIALASLFPAEERTTTKK